MNIILISMDTVRADHLSCYGYALPTTPNLDRIASEGVLFEQAFCHVAGTWLSHSTMFTGNHLFELPWDDPDMWNNKTFQRSFIYKLDSAGATLVECLSSSGYRTAGFVSGVNLSKCWSFDRGFKVYDDIVHQNDLPHRLMRRLFKVPPYRRCDKTCDLALSWLDSVDKTDNFFLFIHFMDAHTPRFAHRGPLRLRGGSRYDQAIALIDHQIGRLADKLNELDLASQTLFIITSDHGECFGERGLPVGHGKDLLEHSIHVPLIMRCHNLNCGQLRYRGVVRQIDLMPTILDILNIDRPETVEGSSLKPLFSGKQLDLTCFCFALAEPYIVAKYNPGVDPGNLSGPLIGIRTRDWKFFRLACHEPAYRELYNITEDPDEQVNLIEQEPDLAKQLENKLMTQYQRLLDYSGYQKIEPDKAVAEQLRALGYIE